MLPAPLRVLAMYLGLMAMAPTMERRPSKPEDRSTPDMAASNPIQTIAVGFILIAVAFVIALTILPVITSAVNTAQGDGNISASDSTLLGLLPTLLIVGLLAGGVVFLFQGFKQIRT